MVVIVPIAAAAFSPLLAWRDPIYIAAGFAGVIAVTLMLLQPLLASGYLAGISVLRARHIHRWVGIALVVLVIAHVVGLWITSPPDVIDALLFVSPTSFSIWGVIAMWALFLNVFLALLRRRFRVRPHTWRRMHGAFAVVIVAGSVIHAILIEGAMEFLSKSVLCALLICASATVLPKLMLKK